MSTGVARAFFTSYFLFRQPRTVVALAEFQVAETYSDESVCFKLRGLSRRSGG